jgi:hypothetical protein
MLYPLLLIFIIQSLTTLQSKAVAKKQATSGTRQHQVKEGEK